MAFLVPLLLPAVIDATANVALGITNAVQGTSSSVTFQIGSHVYTSAKPFPLHKLPPEIREEIILMALEGSKELIQQALLVSRPFALAPTAIPLHNPLHDPNSPHYRSIRGEWQVTNGYPVSSWKWLMVNREWRDVCRRWLWRDVVLDTPRSYELFLKFLADGQLDDILTSIHSLWLDQGFEDPSELYRIIRHPKLLNLRRLSILASWPFSSTITARPTRLFKFGIQLAPAPPVRPLRLRADDDDEYDDVEEVEYEREEDIKRLDCFALGLPLELSTNEVSRQHLAVLRPKRLEITLLLQYNPLLMTELADMLADKITELSIRYLASDRTAIDLPDPALLLSSTMDRFHAVDIHLPALTSPSPVTTILQHRPYQGQPDPHTSFSKHLVNLISLDPDRRKRYAVWLEEAAPPMGGFRPGWMKAEERVLWERPVDVPYPVKNEVVVVDEDDLARGVGKEAGPSTSSERKRRTAGKKDEARDDEPDTAGSEHWERETHLKLFGGLLSLRLESKKH